MSNVNEQIYLSESGMQIINNWKLQQGERRSIFILGAGMLQLPAIYCASQMGLRVHVADGNPKAIARESAHVFHKIDLRNYDSLIKTAKAIAESEGLHAVLTLATDFSLPVAMIAKECNLAGIAPEAALRASEKDRMRQALMKAGLRVPNFICLDAEVARKCSPYSPPVSNLELRFPLVCKPVDNMGARGVREIAKKTDCPSAILEALRYSRSGKVILEEKIQGKEFSLDALISTHGFHPMGIAQRIIDFPPYFVERGHSFPSGLESQEEQEMFACLKKASESLGITLGASKGDLFLTEEGPVIGELAARLSGGYMSGWTFPLFSGVNSIIGAILIALGEELPNEFCQQKPFSYQQVAERGIISAPGIIEAIHIPSFNEPSFCFLSRKHGDRVCFPHNNVEKCGNIIQAASEEEINKSLASCWIRLRPENTEELHALLNENFPPAYPRLFEHLRTAIHTGKVIGFDNTQYLQDQNNKPAITIPEWIYTSKEVDWNYRNIDDSLTAMKFFIPSLHISLLKENRIESIWKSSYYNLNIILSLLKGSFQHAVYYLEVCQKNTEIINEYLIES